MQISQLVHVRRRRWRVSAIRPYDSCQLVTLARAGPSVSPAALRVLTPFDIVDPIDRAERGTPRVVRMKRWRRVCRALLAEDLPPGSLRSAARAGIDLLPHQLEPALAVARGDGCRLLLADDVGLGKTIQAALIVAELCARSLADRVLVLTPAGLRDQWARELADRFHVQPVIADARMLRGRTSELPIGVNPWTTVPVAIASIDYVKRAEVLPAVQACRWDIVVIDEAHGAIGESDRHHAVRSLSASAPYVLLLTATPHSGDRRAFVSLCDVGAVGGEPLLIFRRTRDAVRGGARRRIHTMSIGQTAGERQMHAVLAAYTEAVRAEHGMRCLALSVLHKRAFSSPWSLAESVERRLAVLASPASRGHDQQLALPLDDPTGELTAEDDAPAWPAHLTLGDAARERRLLTKLAESARTTARGSESKLRALVRLLRRVRESAIVFTEYRDTLVHIRACLERPALVLHGGLTREERAETIDAFCRDSGAILLSTDAGCEGLNLHARCRLVISLELPWNPMRLEQRIGRVDRIGQRATVHAFHFVAAQTGEARILQRLKERVARARLDVAAPDPVGVDEERAVAKLVVTPMERAASADPTEREDFAEQMAALAEQVEREALAERRDVSPDLRADAEREAMRLAETRRFIDRSDDIATGNIDRRRPLIARARRRRRLRRSLGHRALFLYWLECEDASGLMIASRLVPLSAPACFASNLDVMRSYVEHAADEWRRTAIATSRRFWETRLRRERAIEDLLLEAVPDLFQPGLFDRRAERARCSLAEARVEQRQDSAARIAILERLADVTMRPPELALVLLP